MGPRAAAGTKVVRLSSSSANKMQLEDVSDTLYVRASLLSDATRKPGPIAPALTVSPAIAELIRGKIDRAPRPIDGAYVSTRAHAFPYSMRLSHTPCRACGIRGTGGGRSGTHGTMVPRQRK